MANIGTRNKLQLYIDDFEIIAKELFEALASNSDGDNSDIDSSKLIDLLVLKETEIRDELKTAAEQREIQKRLDSLKSDVDVRDQHIKQLQQKLKESETILSTALYQAKQKLKSIRQANQNKVSSEELIRYAHKISASNAVSAPPNWAPGDSRRPYPLDVEMRMGYLAALGELNTS